MEHMKIWHPAAPRSSAISNGLLDGSLAPHSRREPRPYSFGLVHVLAVRGCDLGIEGRPHLGPSTIMCTPFDMCSSLAMAAEVQSFLAGPPLAIECRVENSPSSYRCEIARISVLWTDEQGFSCARPKISVWRWIGNQFGLATRLISRMLTVGQLEI